MKILLRVLDVSEDVTLAGGVTISLTMIQQILGITLLVVNICLIVAKCVIKIIDKCKNGDTKGAVETIEETQEEINSLKENNGKQHNSK